MAPGAHKTSVSLVSLSSPPERRPPHLHPNRSVSGAQRRRAASSHSQLRLAAPLTADPLLANWAGSRHAALRTMRLQRSPPADNAGPPAGVARAVSFSPTGRDPEVRGISRVGLRDAELARAGRGSSMG